MKREGRKKVDEHQEVQNSLDASHALALSNGHTAEKEGKAREAGRWFYIAGAVAVLAALWRSKR